MMLQTLLDNAESITDTLDETLTSSSVISIFVSTARGFAKFNEERRKISGSAFFAAIYETQGRTSSERTQHEHVIVCQALTKELLID